MNIYFIQYESSPTPESENANQFGGAYISGWIKASSTESAKTTFSAAIGKLDWELAGCEKAFEIPDSYYDEGDESFEYYNQAVLDGEAYVIDTWPNESP